MEQAPRSIHHQRRWFYVLWGGLLLAALGVLAAWRSPASVGEAKVRFAFKLLDGPEGLSMDAWRGNPEDLQRGPLAFTPCAGPGPGGSARSSAVPVLLARRRWVKDFHPLTTTLVVLRLRPSQGPPRYVAYDLGPDLRGGLLKERRVLEISTALKWPTLSTEENHPSRIF